MTDDVLTHDLDADPFTCSHCGDGDPDLDANAHTLYDWLRNQAGPPSVAEWCAMLQDTARARVVAAEGDYLACWCGHTLHYPDCACEPGTGPDSSSQARRADGLTCAKRYRLEAFTPGRDGSVPSGWSCPAEDSEHWPATITPAGFARWAVECGDCGAESLIDAALGTVERVP